MLTAGAAVVMLGYADSRAAEPGVIGITQWGDSTTEGLYTENGQSKVAAPSKTIESLLQQKFGPVVTVRFSSQRGSTLKNMLEGTGNFTMPLAEAIKHDTSSIATLKFGINDQAVYDVATYRGYLVQAVQIMRDAGKTVVLIEQNPTLNYRTDYGRAYAEATAQTAAQFGLPLIRNYQATLNINGWASMMTDSLHPNAQLYALIARNQVPVLEAVVAAALH